MIWVFQKARKGRLLFVDTVRYNLGHGAKLEFSCFVHGNYPKRHRDQRYICNSVVSVDATFTDLNSRKRANAPQHNINIC
jgi:hypothetical protein